MTALAERVEASGLHSEYTPRQVAELGAQFVPQTLRYLGVPAQSVLDAAQDVFLVALRRLHDFEGRSSLTTWLYGICVRVAHDYRRRQKRSRESLVESLPDIVAPAQQESLLACADWQRELGALLDQLDESQRAVFVLYEIQRLSMKEAAEALGCPLPTAYFRHKSARTRVLEGFRRRIDTEGQ
jgi:RNA polymerase sigma-70 factor, ECF subfamily